MFYIYILHCSNGSYYIGHTENLEKRLSEHTQGFCGYTKERRPFKLVFYDTSFTRDAALGLEIQMKKWTRKKKEVLINYGWDGIQHYEKKYKFLRN